ncbi:MAG: serine hydrolase [Gemmatimonadales bacterium]
MRAAAGFALATLLGCAPVDPHLGESAGARVDRVLGGLRPALEIRGEPPVRWTLAERMAHHHVPGLSIAVIDSGRIAWARAVGLREAGSPDSVDNETVFQAGSISKPTFAVLAMRLVEDGVLELDQDVNERLSSWRVPENRFARSEKVTLRRLLSHRAGLTVHGFPGYPPGQPVPTVVQILDGAAPANTAPVRVDTFPGAIERYSGGGTTVAMLLVTDVTGRGLPELMDDLVFGPVGMSRSSYRQPLPEALRANAASGHRPDGAMVTGRYNTYPEMSAAGLWTTATDLAKLAIELQRIRTGTGGSLMGPATLAEMFTPQGPPGRAGFGIGYHLDGSGPELEFAHDGADLGFRASFVAFAERGQGAVVMTNGDNGDGLAAEILAAVAVEYDWPSHRPIEKAVVPIDAARLARLAGNYAFPFRRGQPAIGHVTLEDGRLYFEAPDAGFGKTELLADSDSTFFTRGSDLPARFLIDAGGRATGLSLAGTIGARVR